MKRLKTWMLWLMDVMVAVFIGPVDSGKRSPRIRELATRRGLYALGFTGVIVLAAGIYTWIARLAWVGSY